MTVNQLVQTAPVLSGLDVLVREAGGRLQSRRVGLVTNSAGVTRTLESSVDVLRAAGIHVVALFSPEHGLAAAVADAQFVASGRDARTGLPVYSLYGDSRRPTAAMLADLDVLLFDLQDVGVRFYTFATTLALALEACAQQKVRLVVLDRPNPIGGQVVEGPLLEPALQSFIGHGPLPIRHGLTLGELAGFYNRELGIHADLEVVLMRGWQRDRWFDQTGLVWVPPSPGMPHLSTATVYPGMCLVEGTNLSEGRGTSLPFEITGAPWLDGYALAEELNGTKLAGVRFRPVEFMPDAAKFAGQICQGIQVHVTERSAFRPVTVGLHVLAACHRQAPDRFEMLKSSWEGQAPHLDLLAGTARARETVTGDRSIDGLVRAWSSDLAGFERIRSNYLLY